MTTLATQIRDAVYDRLSILDGYTSFRKAPVPQLQPDALPALSVFISGETLTPDGDDNAGEPHFEASVTIAVSVVRGFDDPSVLSGDIDADVDAIEEGLLCDPTFVTFGPDALLEGVSGIKRRRLYPQSGKDGETYFAELRLEITFRTRVSFEPDIDAAFEGVTITARPHVAGKPVNDTNIRPITIVADPPTE